MVFAVVKKVPDLKLFSSYNGGEGAAPAVVRVSCIVAGYAIML